MGASLSAYAYCFTPESMHGSARATGGAAGSIPLLKLHPFNAAQTEGQRCEPGAAVLAWRDHSRGGRHRRDAERISSRALLAA
jgi:hypothetical protein